MANMQKTIEPSQPLNSHIYTGRISHARLKKPSTKSKPHRFSYDVFMMYLDLDELEKVFSKSIFWSHNKSALARFKEEDYFFDKDKGSIKETVIQFVEKKSGVPFRGGRVCLLTNLRYFGFIINPISCYYCFDNRNQLKYLVAEVTNTPWKEVKRYLLPTHLDEKKYTNTFPKDLHVSPFMPMNMIYHWSGNVPDDKISIKLECHHQLKNKETVSIGSETDNSLAFVADLNLQAHIISTSSLNRVLIQYPLITVKIFVGIHWQAINLFIKRIPIVKHLKRKELVNES